MFSQTTFFFRKEVLAFAEYFGFNDVFICFRDVSISDPSISIQQMLLSLLLYSSHEPIEPQPYPVIYVVTDPVRGLLDRKRSEAHLQSSNKSKIKNKNKKHNETKHKRQKESINNKIHMS